MLWRACVTESELSGAGMAPNSPTHPLAPLSARHTVGPHTLKGMESCFSSLCCSPREPAPAPEHPPLPGQLSCVFPSHFRQGGVGAPAPPLLCAEPGGGRVATAPPGCTSQWALRRRARRSPSRVSPAFPGPKLLRQESVGLQAQNPYSWLCDHGHIAQPL